jgi:flagella basal body P-ring formation protein FlgA
MCKLLLTITTLTALQSVLLFSVAQAAPQLQLELRQNVSIADEQFVLEDLVSSYSGREDFWQAIRSVKLGRITNQPVQLDSGNILGLLAAQGYDWRLIEIAGAGSVQIVQSGQAISARDIVDLVVSGSSEALGVTVELLERPDNQITDQLFLGGMPEMRLRWPGDSTSSLPDAVEFTIDGRLERVLLLHQYADFRLPVVTSLVDLQRSDIVFPEQLECRSATCRAGSHVMTTVQQAIGMEASRHISRGEQIELNSLVLPWTVKRNALVQLVADTPGLHCSAEGRALSDGHIGDRISVKRSEDGQTFMGVINSEGQVEIE